MAAGSCVADDRCLIAYNGEFVFRAERRFRNAVTETLLSQVNGGRESGKQANMALWENLCDPSQEKQPLTEVNFSLAFMIRMSKVKAGELDQVIFYRELSQILIKYLPLLRANFERFHLAPPSESLELRDWAVSFNAEMIDADGRELALSAVAAAQSYLRRIFENKLFRNEFFAVLPDELQEEFAAPLVAVMSVEHMIESIAQLPDDAPSATLVRLLSAFLVDPEGKLLHNPPQFFTCVVEYRFPDGVDREMFQRAILCLRKHFYKAEADSELAAFLLQHPELFSLLCKSGDNSDVTAKLLMLGPDLEVFTTGLINAAKNKLPPIDFVTFKDIFKQNIHVLMVSFFKLLVGHDFNRFLDVVRVDDKTLRQHLRFCITASHIETVADFIERAISPVGHRARTSQVISTRQAFLCTEFFLPEILSSRSLSRDRSKIIRLHPIFAAKLASSPGEEVRAWRSHLDDTSFLSADHQDLLKEIMCRSLFATDGRMCWSNLFSNTGRIAVGFRLLMYALRILRHRDKLLGPGVSIEEALFTEGSDLHRFFNRISESDQTQILRFTSPAYNRVRFAKRAARSGLANIYKNPDYALPLLNVFTHADFDDDLATVLAVIVREHGLVAEHFSKLFDAEYRLHPAGRRVFDSCSVAAFGNFFAESV